MRTLILKAKDFKEVDGYKEYTGKEDLTNFEGNVVYGDVTETGLPDEKETPSGKTVKVKLRGGEIVEGELV